MGVVRWTLPIFNQFHLARLMINGLEDTKRALLDINVLDNQTYLWYGNQWVPPPGVPMYRKDDMQRAFSQFDTLWIGDSTMRRAYATMFALMNSTNSSVSIQELDDYRVIDVNRRSDLGLIDEDSCRSRRKGAKKHLEHDLCNMWTHASLCRKLGKQLFDYTRVDCLRDLYSVSRLKKEIKRYSLVILGLGIHDILKPDKCALPGKGKARLEASLDTEGLYENLNQSFHTAWKGTLRIAKTIQQNQEEDNPVKAVLWRTSGFHAADEASVTKTILHLNRLSLVQFHNGSIGKSGNGTIAMVDWGAAMLPRSFPPHRIEGDINAHYGLEARMLMAQMTTQQVMNLLVHTHVDRSTAPGVAW